MLYSTYGLVSTRQPIYITMTLFNPAIDPLLLADLIGPTPVDTINPVIGGEEGINNYDRILLCPSIEGNLNSLFWVFFK